MVNQLFVQHEVLVNVNLSLPKTVDGQPQTHDMVNNPIADQPRSTHFLVESLSTQRLNGYLRPL